MPITLPPIAGGDGSSWVTTAEADTYFAKRYGIGALWSQFDAATATKTAILVTAQQPIQNSTDYEFTDELLATPSQAMKDAVCEQAFAMLLDPDMDLRSIVIAQGVEEAGIVQEIYRRAGSQVVIAPRARMLLKALENDDNHEITLVR